MKKSFFSLLCVFALTAFTANNFFDTTKPLKGIAVTLQMEVDATGRPSSISMMDHTDANGKFVLKVKEGGKFKLKVSYKDILVKIGIIEKVKNPNGKNYRITEDCDDGGTVAITINGKKLPARMTIGSANETCIIMIPAGGGTIQGSLRFNVELYVEE